MKAFESSTTTPDNLTTLVKAEYAKWGKIVSAAGAKVD
jgi:hypothetical protein